MPGPMLDYAIVAMLSLGLIFAVSCFMVTYTYNWKTYETWVIIFESSYVCVNLVVFGILFFVFWGK